MLIKLGCLTKKTSLISISIKKRCQKNLKHKITKKFNRKTLISKYDLKEFLDTKNVKLNLMQSYRIKKRNQ